MARSLAVGLILVPGSLRTRVYYIRNKFYSTSPNAGLLVITGTSMFKKNLTFQVYRTLPYNYYDKSCFE
jgi:hypothetical protein